MARRTHDFQTIRSEGGLLPADLLGRVLDRSGKLAGTRPEDYGLPPGERLNEAITQSWNRLRKHWAEFQAARLNLPESEAGTGLTNERWNLPLLRELDFGLLPTSAGPEIDGRTYAISRLFGPVPVHLIGCGLSLDRRAAGQRGAAAANPHGLVQEFLNRSDAHLWALLSNGLRLRVLRDNQALSRQSFLEFDLEAMFSGEVYSDFVLLWLVSHATRFAPREGELPETCWLEQWTQEAEAQGVAALKELGRQVEQALVILGEGFTSHPKNSALRDAIRSGTLQPTELHAQLLRLVYRLIFLFVAEDRTLEGQSLLHPPDDSEAAHIARERYAAHYSTVRLREMAGRIKGSRHGDLWKQFQLLGPALSGDAASQAIRQQLALPALGSFLWDPASTPDLNDAELTNFDLLEALRHLAFTRQGKVLRPVDYRNLGAEELGGIYESLLALTPQVSGDGARFSFAEFAGNERKTSGSYYTPDSLVQCLLDSALDPVVEVAIKGKSPVEAAEAILALKVCDPAVGSGHFLVGAAHRLARHLARVRALAEGEGEPSPLFYQHALRDVIGRCLYGVDLNPMAAELCRVSLWLEALEPGKPLSFLDHHIRVGNSLLGTTPELIAGGLPDDAFKPIEGDDKKICAALKKRNKQEREGGQMDLGLPMVAEARAEYETLASRSQSVDQAPDDSLEAIRRKAEQFRRLVVSPEYRHRQTIADAWCAAFVWPKTPNAPKPITTETIRRLEEDSEALDLGQDEELERLANQYQFFHWQFAFPEVFAMGGFDCVLGNPPWDRVKIQEKEWFSAYSPDIASAPNAAARKQKIADLKRSQSSLYQSFLEDLREAEGISHLLRDNGRFPLCGRGDINVYAVFAELFSCLVNGLGNSGAILPSGIATDDTTKLFFQSIAKTNRLNALFGFINEELLFPTVLHNFKFCILIVGGGNRTSKSATIVFNCHNVAQCEDADRRFSLTGEDLALLNPNTGTCPVFFWRPSAVLTKAIYRRHPVIQNENCENKWALKYGTMFHMSNDSAKFEIDSIDGIHTVPLYEAKMFEQYNHRYTSYEHLPSGGRSHMLPPNPVVKLQDPSYRPRPCYFVTSGDVEKAIPKDWTRKWLMGFREITSAGLWRTTIYTVLPRYGTSHKIPIVYFADACIDLALSYLASVNSFVFDFLSRQKLGGASFSFFVKKQLPLPQPEKFREAPLWDSATTVDLWLRRRVLELSYTAWDLESFASDFGWNAPPFRWIQERRFLLKCELDAALFHLFCPADVSGNWKPARVNEGCAYEETQEQIDELNSSFRSPRDALDYALETFAIIRAKDCEQFGEYRTKRVILEIYDAMHEAMRTGQPYETLLNPPPGPPLDADGNFVSYADIADDPPPHIHLPRVAVPGSNVALQLSDLATHFPDEPFRLRLNTGADARVLQVRPFPTSDLTAGDKVVLASPNLQRQGAPVPAAVGRLRVESRTDAENGSTYLLVSIRRNEGMAQARFSEDEWQGLTTVGVVMDETSAEAGNG